MLLLLLFNDSSGDVDGDGQGGCAGLLGDTRHEPPITPMPPSALPPTMLWWS